jgi:3-deoxy-D-manno-octulosonic-acid transferase
MSTNKQREIIRAIKQKNSALRTKKQDLLKAAISSLDDEEEEDFYRHHSRSPQS